MALNSQQTEQIDATRNFRMLNPSQLATHSSATLPTGLRIPGIAAQPPPLPPRLHGNTSLSYLGGPGGNFSGFHSPPYYGRYGGGYAGGYPSISGCGGYGSSLYGGGYGMPFRGGYNGRSLDDMDSRFFQIAEASSRPAFQSVESIVHTFGSVSMMLESTLNAMYTSFHAVLGVAENFNRLRHLSLQIAKYMSALAIVRTIYWFYRRLLYMLGLIRTRPSSEDIWNAVEHSSGIQSAQSQYPIHSTWPIVTFVGFLLGAPYVIFKFISSVKGNTEERWDPRIHQSGDAIAIYNFKASSNNELSITAGERLKIPSNSFMKGNMSGGWMYAVNQNNRIGLVPYNYIRRIVIKKQEPAVLTERNEQGENKLLQCQSDPEICDEQCDKPNISSDQTLVADQNGQDIKTT